MIVLDIPECVYVYILIRVRIINVVFFSKTFKLNDLYILFVGK